MIQAGIGSAILPVTGWTAARRADIQTEGWAPMKPTGPQSCEASVGSSDDRPTLFEVFGKLGLHMEPQRALIDMFVIDHVERPSEN